MPELSECTPPMADPARPETPDQSACANRLDNAFRERFTPATASPRNDLIVAHGNVIRYFVMKALGVEPRTWTRLSVAHASITIIQVTATGAFRVLSIGDVGHLPPGMQSWGTPADPELTIP